MLSKVLKIYIKIFYFYYFADLISTFLDLEETKLNYSNAISWSKIDFYNLTFLKEFLFIDLINNESETLLIPSFLLKYL